MLRNTVRGLRRKSLTIGLWALSLIVVSAVSAAASGLITGKQIQNGTITSVDIKNGSVAWADLSPTTRTRINTGVKGASRPGSANAGAPGAKGKDGVNGKDGVDGTNGIDGTNGANGADGAAGLANMKTSNRTIVVPAIGVVPTNLTYHNGAAQAGRFEHVRYCDGDRIPVAAGYNVVNESTDVQLVISEPTDLVNVANGNRYHKAWRFVFKSTGEGAEVRPWVVCAEVKNS